jgi:hypothetical protein
VESHVGPFSSPKALSSSAFVSPGASWCDKRPCYPPAGSRIKAKARWNRCRPGSGQNTRISLGQSQFWAYNRQSVDTTLT